MRDTHMADDILLRLLGQVQDAELAVRGGSGGARGRGRGVVRRLGGHGEDTGTEAKGLNWSALSSSGNRAAGSSWLPVPCLGRPRVEPRGGNTNDKRCRRPRGAGISSTVGAVVVLHMSEE